jgi:hypothetical protein
MLGRVQNGRCVEDVYWLKVTSTGRSWVRDIKHLFPTTTVFLLAILIKVELRLFIAG